MKKSNKKTVGKSYEPRQYITDGVEEIPKARDISVCLPPGFKKTSLSIITKDGENKIFPISKKVAEVLIAEGIPYQG